MSLANVRTRLRDIQERARDLEKLCDAAEPSDPAEYRTLGAMQSGLRMLIEDALVASNDVAVLRTRAHEGW